MSRALGLAFLSTIAALAWMLGGLPGLAYLAAYALSTAPGWPLGWALFGRDHAGGWVAGALLGYALTSTALWVALAVGLVGPGATLAAWITVNAACWLAASRLRGPLVILPRWGSSDTAALLLVLFLVPALVWHPFRRIGEPDADGALRYRAYFTADFVWHLALTAELARGELPPRNPYAADQPLHYYWPYFLLPAAAARAAPGSAASDITPWLAINATGAGTLFVAMLAVMTWCVVPRRGPAMGAVTLGVLAASAEGLWLAVRYWREGVPLDALRDFNVDAATAWIYRSVSIDGIPRSLWYTPQHAGAFALGLIALVVAGAAGARARVPAILLAGLALAAAVSFSPLPGGLCCLVYGLTVTADALRAPREAWRLVPRHALAAVPVALALAACVGAGMVEGAGGALVFSFRGRTATEIVTVLSLALGPLLAIALPGFWPGRPVPTRALPPLFGVLLALPLLFGARLAGDAMWVGWRAGQLLLLSLPALAARTLAWGAERRPALTLGVYLLALSAGLPTTVLDWRNAQDVENRRMGPGFRWTVPVTRDEQAAATWLRQATPPGTVVQPHIKARGRDTWSLVPSFAQRRMYAGQPISLLHSPEYDRRTAEVTALFATSDPTTAWQMARDRGIDQIYVGDAERRAVAESALAKFDARPDLFYPSFTSAGVRIYAVRRAEDVPPAESRLPPRLQR
jgi:hypothetical protein